MNQNQQHHQTIPIPIPKRNPPNHLGPEQWNILAALADTVIPSLTVTTKNKLLQHPVSSEAYDAASKRIQDLVATDGSEGLVDEYLAESLTSAPEFREDMLELVNTRMHEQARKDLIFVLNVLSTRAGAIVLTGYTTPLDALPVQTRELILQGWASSRFALLRNIHRSISTVFKLLWARDSITLSRILDFAYRPTEQPHTDASYPFNFLEPSASVKDEPETLDTDVVIVGSGCGGAVAAKTIAEAGISVVVTDKGHYWSPSHLPMSPREGAYHLFHNGCVQQTDESSMTIVAGSTWGGGGTVNWSASLQTEGSVRREWANKDGLPYFTSSAFQADMDAVCERMGVGLQAVQHNKGNRALLEGARKLGWNAKAVPQNTGGGAHNCGHCTLGCGSCGKKGPTETFLPDAAKAGAQMMEGFDCQEVVWEGRKAVGVKGFWTSKEDYLATIDGATPAKREVIIKAKRVIISGGTLNSPLLLKRSKISNPQVGRNLKLHPVSMIAAVWPEVVKPWEGSILTSVVSEFSNLDGAGHGVKIEATCMLPNLLLPFFPWKSGLQFKEFAAKVKYMTGYISLARDKDSGVVFPDPKDGRCRVDYTVSQTDRSHILEGVVRMSELLYVEGAKEIHTAIPDVEPYVRPDPPVKSPSVNDPEFRKWTEKLRATGLKAPQSGFASAHQMGSCRMGSRPTNSVVDPQGKVWGSEGLYVCDASVLPSASGVNPMITTMGVCRGIARGLVEDLRNNAGGINEKARL